MLDNKNDKIINETKSNETKGVSIRLDDISHKKLKIFCFTHGTTIKDFCHDAISRAVSEIEDIEVLNPNVLPDKRRKQKKEKMPDLM